MAGVVRQRRQAHRYVLGPAGPLALTPRPATEDKQMSVVVGLVLAQAMQMLIVVLVRVEVRQDVFPVSPEIATPALEFVLAAQLVRQCVEFAFLAAGGAGPVQLAVAL